MKNHTDVMRSGIPVPESCKLFTQMGSLKFKVFFSGPLVLAQGSCRSFSAVLSKMEHKKVKGSSAGPESM